MPAPEPSFTSADNVRALCALRGITHRELARAAGLPEPTVSRWCTGAVRRPREAQLAQVARALGVPLARLASASSGYAAALALACEANGGEPPAGLARGADLEHVLSRWREQLAAPPGDAPLG